LQKHGFAKFSKKSFPIFPHSFIDAKT